MTGRLLNEFPDDQVSEYHRGQDPLYQSIRVITRLGKMIAL
jgi:hypothetical protein